MLISISKVRFCMISISFFFFYLRNPGTTVHTRDPQEPQTPRPPWTAAVALHWWQAKVATPKMVSTHSTDDTTHIVCPFELSVSIRLGVCCVLTLRATHCVHTICLSACALLYMSSVRELHLQCSIQRTLFMCLFTSASTYSIMGEMEPLTWFSNATNVLHVQKIWPWNYRTDAMASKWARLAYRVLCLTPTAVQKEKAKTNKLFKIHSLSLTPLERVNREGFHCCQFSIRLLLQYQPFSKGREDFNIKTVHHGGGWCTCRGLQCIRKNCYSSKEITISVFVWKCVFCGFVFSFM